MDSQFVEKGPFLTNSGSKFDKNGPFLSKVRPKFVKNGPFLTNWESIPAKPEWIPSLTRMAHSRQRWIPSLTRMAHSRQRWIPSLTRMAHSRQSLTKNGSFWSVPVTRRPPRGPSYRDPIELTPIHAPKVLCKTKLAARASSRRTKTCGVSNFA